MFNTLKITLLICLGCMLCNIMFAQYRTISFLSIIHSSLNNKDSVFLTKYNNIIYYYQNDDIYLYKKSLKKEKKTFNIQPLTKLIVYQDRIKGNAEIYHLLKTKIDIAIIVMEISVITIKENLITFEVSYYESTNKDILPDIRQDKGIITHVFDRHLVGKNTIIFEWNCKKKKWFEQQIEKDKNSPFFR